MFQFKQFTISQEKTAMKVGTDGVLLGAWARIATHSEKIVDIGAGTGLVALMMAQRSNAQQIDALEIDEDAYEECVANFENSPWADRLFCYHAALIEFAEEIDETYDTIVCNPPFFTENYKTPQEARNKARFEDAMPFEHLVAAAKHLLNDNGVFNIIVPYKEWEHLVALAHAKDLYPFKITHIKGTAESPFKRSLMAFSTTPSEINFSELILETKRNVRTEAYQELTSNFYLDK